MNWRNIYKAVKSQFITKKIVTEKVDNILEAFKNNARKLESVSESIEFKKDRINEAQERLRLQKAGLNVQGIRIKETMIKIKEIID